MALIHFLEHTAAGRPGQTAYLRRGMPVTYAELRADVARLAGTWAAAGVMAGDRVAVLAGNSPRFLEAYFAAAELRAVLVPLGTRLAPPELAAILELAQARVLCIDPGHTELARRIARAPHLGLAHWADVEQPGLTWLEAPTAPWPGGFPAPSDLAHLYFTSGTTGRPKGVMLTHKNVAEHARQAIAELGLRPADGWGHFAPMFHLADAWATFAATAAGARHHFLERFEADAALQQLQDEAITLSNLVPTMLQRMLALPRPAGEWNRLRLVLSGGAPIAPSLVQRIMDFFGCEYAQTYGLTETSPYLTFSLPRPGERHPEGPAGIARRARTGRAFGRVGLRVVDEAGIDVPQDDRAVGEIWASGPTVTPGYWRDADATAAAFAGEWFRTGDLATWDATGSVNIVDRKKDMILTGGENVYSIEVEAALLAHPGVLEAAAFGVPDADWGEAVWAAVVWAPGATADLERLQQHLHAQLAGYKCPKRILECPELPKTSSGKIQKRLLRESLRPGGTLAP